MLGSPAGLVTDAGESNLHEIIAAKNVIVMDGETLKIVSYKINMQNVYTGLKVTRVICTSVYEVQCTTTTLLETF